MYRIKIVNINECINLQNYSSEDLMYSAADIKPLINLKRLHSYLD